MDPYEARNGIAMVYATVYDSQATAKADGAPAGRSASPVTRSSIL